MINNRVGRIATVNFKLRTTSDDLWAATIGVTESRRLSKLVMLVTGLEGKDKDDAEISERVDNAVLELSESLRLSASATAIS